MVPNRINGRKIQPANSGIGGEGLEDGCGVASGVASEFGADGLIVVEGVGSLICVVGEGVGSSL